MLEAHRGCRMTAYSPSVTRVPVRNPLRRLTHATAYMRAPTITREAPTIAQVAAENGAMTNRGYAAKCAMTAATKYTVVGRAHFGPTPNLFRFRVILATAIR